MQLERKSVGRTSGCDTAVAARATVKTVSFYETSEGLHRNKQKLKS